MSLFSALDTTGFSGSHRFWDLESLGKEVSSIEQRGDKREKGRKPKPAPPPPIRMSLCRLPSLSSEVSWEGRRERCLRNSLTGDTTTPRLTMRGNPSRPCPSACLLPEQSLVPPGTEGLAYPVSNPTYTQGNLVTTWPRL